MTVYSYLLDMATCEIWLPVRYGYLRDISYKRIPISSDLTYPAILPVSEIWLPARYNYLRDMATREIWILTRYGYLRGMTTCKILAIGRFLFLVISPIPLYCLLARYGYQEIASDAIWLPARYACLQDVSYKQIHITSDLTYPAISPNK